jgi:acyl dehydratase
MTRKLFHVNDGPRLVGARLGHSPWVVLDQRHVDLFAEATRDDDWAHVDVERAREKSPYGGTIVQGFLMMSMLIHLHHAMGLPPEGAGFALNYGMDKVRFTDVVMTGARVRVAVDLIRFEPRGKGIVMATKDVMEVEGKTKPCMVAEWLTWLDPSTAHVMS